MHVICVTLRWPLLLVPTLKGGGVTGKLTRNVSVYGDASYLESVSGEKRIALKGNVGLRVTW
jgi:outer membrane autotransporter protein